MDIFEKFVAKLGIDTAELKTEADIEKLYNNFISGVEAAAEKRLSNVSAEREKQITAGVFARSEKAFIKFLEAAGIEIKGLEEIPESKGRFQELIEKGGELLTGHIRTLSETGKGDTEKRVTALLEDQKADKALISKLKADLKAEGEKVTAAIQEAENKYLLKDFKAGALSKIVGAEGRKFSVKPSVISTIVNAEMTKQGLALIREGDGFQLLDANKAAVKRPGSHENHNFETFIESVIQAEGLEILNNVKDEKDEKEIKGAAMEAAPPDVRKYFDNNGNGNGFTM